MYPWICRFINFLSLSECISKILSDMRILNKSSVSIDVLGKSFHKNSMTFSFTFLIAVLSTFYFPWRNFIVWFPQIQIFSSCFPCEIFTIDPKHYENLTHVRVPVSTFLKLVQIVNHYPGHFFHVSCFQPVDLWGIQQNISQSAKILPLLQYPIPERCACMFHRAHVQMFLVRTCICMEPCEFFGSSLLSYELKFPIS